MSPSLTGRLFTAAGPGGAVDIKIHYIPLASPCTRGPTARAAVRQAVRALQRLLSESRRSPALLDPPRRAGAVPVLLVQHGHRARRQSGRWPPNQPSTGCSRVPHSDKLPASWPGDQALAAVSSRPGWRSVTRTVGLTLPVSLTVTVRPQVSSYLLWPGSPTRPDRRPAYCGHCCGGRPILTA